MARPERHDVDYFPFYIKDGRTLFILESKYGCKGTGFFTNVMRFLCSTPYHHFCIQENADRLYFFAKTKCDEESGADMLDIMANTRKLHTQLWVSAAVIVSEALLESIKDAYRKRTNPIITIQEITQKYVSSGIGAVSGGRNTQSSGITTGNKPQTKLKESKEKKIYKRKTTFTPPSQIEVVKYFTQNGYQEDVGKRAFEYYNIANWKDATGKQVNNWKQKMIAVWFKDENKPTQGNESWRISNK